MHLRESIRRRPSTHRDRLYHQILNDNLPSTQPFDFLICRILSHNGVLVGAGIPGCLPGGMPFWFYCRTATWLYGSQVHPSDSFGRQGFISWSQNLLSGTRVLHSLTRRRALPL